MSKRIICLLIAMALIICLAPVGTGQVHAAGSDHQTQIDKMNALLNGLDLRSQFTQKAVAQWSDEAIADAIYQKLCWDYQFSDHKYTAQFRVEPENYFQYKLSGLEKLSQSCFGRSFPKNVNSGNLDINGDTVYVNLSAGDSVSLAVQDYYVSGDRVTAVGAAAYLTSGGPAGSFDGYFQAEFKKNSSSIYGYTLISLREIKGNQNFSGLTATASSTLKESSVTHNATRVLDGRLDTAWVESANGVGVGEWIRISNSSGKKMGLVGIELNLGYQLDQRRLENNGWPTELLIECEGGYSQKVELYYYDSIIFLDQPVKTSWVKLTILDAMSGKTYDDTCISEIQLLGLDFEQMIPKEDPVTTQPPATTPKPTQPPATTPKPTQPPATTPRPTQPTRPQPTAHQNPSGSHDSTHDGESGQGGNHKFIVIAIIAVVLVCAVAGIAMLLSAKKKAASSPNTAAAKAPQGTRPYYPPSAPPSTPKAQPISPSAPKAQPSMPPSPPSAPPTWPTAPKAQPSMPPSPPSVPNPQPVSPKNPSDFWQRPQKDSLLE